MKPLNPETDGIRQYDCYGNRTDTTNPIIAEGETLVVLTEEDKVLLAAAMQIAVSARHGAVSAVRENNPQYDGSGLDTANTRFIEDMMQLGHQLEGLLPSTENPIDQAIKLELQAIQEQ